MYFYYYYYWNDCLCDYIITMSLRFNIMITMIGGVVNLDTKDREKMWKRVS